LRYRLLWESSPDAVLLMDTERQIGFANPAIETVFGYKAEEIVGQKLETLLPRELRSSEALSIEQYLSTGNKDSLPRIIETIGRRKDNRDIVTEVTFSHMEMHGERRHVAFIRDITARKRAERELRQNQEQFRVAREIQQRLFPKGAPEIAGFDLAGVTYPAEATGGDYFDYLPMTDGSVGIVVADVTGHGVGPALLMAEARAYLRTLAANREDIGEILTSANRILSEDIGGERYVTLFLGRIVPGPKRFYYANAGHPPAYVIDAAGTVKCHLKRTAVPLGIRPDTKYAGDAHVDLASGDMVLVLTDGIEETMGPDDSFFGIERTLDVVRANRDKPAREILDELYRAVREYSRYAPQVDDVTAILVKVL
jgi:PAS domain S-box-containing protein